MEKIMALITPFNVILGVVFIPLLLFMIIKSRPSLPLSSGVGVTKIKYLFSPFKLLWKAVSSPWKLIGWAFVFGIGYGVYSTLPTPEGKTFHELSKNLAELELQPAKEKLASLNKKVKEGTPLTEEEKGEAMDTNKKIAKVRKDYAKGRLAVAPAPVMQAPSVAPIVWDWTFEWEATPEQLHRNINQEKGLINDARVLSHNENVLKFNYKRPSGKLVELTLSRNGSAEFYHGKVSQPDLYLRVWLIQDKSNNFSGVFDNGPNTTQINIFLKRKL